MKNSLSKVVLATILATVPLMAGNYSYETYSLFAIEGGMTSISADTTVANQVYGVEEAEIGNIGLKIGAQGNDFRAFLSARHYVADEFSRFDTLGGELQYMFNFSNFANFFLGANVGQAYVKFDSTTNNPSLETSSMYYGADSGFNFHITKMVDLELGGKYMVLDINEDRLNSSSQNVNYSIDRMYSGYASVIFKWQMN